MRRLLIPVIVLITTIFLFSCAQKIPVPENGQYGRAAIPAEISNSVKGQQGFASFYRILSSENDRIIELYPSRGLDFIFSEELPPGHYSFDRVIVYNNDPNSSSTVKQYGLKLDPPITVTVVGGKLSIPTAKIIIRQFETGPFTFRLTFETSSLTLEQRRQYAAELAKLENSELWEYSEI